MITLYADSKQYQNTKNYIARILGRDSKFTFRREFVGKNDFTTDDPGLYETCDIDRKGRTDHSYHLVIPRPVDCPPRSERADKDWISFNVSRETAMTIAKRVDAGEELLSIVGVEGREDGYRHCILTKGQAKKAAVTATMDSAIEQCWAVLSLMAEPEAKKVLAALRVRVSPPKPKAAAAAEPPATDE